MPYLNGFQLFNMKQQMRFAVLSLDGIQAYHVRAINLPNVDQNPVVVDTVNSDYKIKGKSRWQDMPVTLYDPIEDSGAQKVHQWLLAHHVSAADVDGYMAEYKRDVTLQYLDPKGAPVETWILHGVFWASVDWGSLDLSSDDLVLIEGVLSVDWAELG